MNILSVDYDYFQRLKDKNTDVSSVFSSYPDGVDLPTSISNVVWASHYASPAQRTFIEQVEPDWDELEIMQGILLAQDKNIPVAVTQSHIHAYRFIKELCDTDEELFVTNVDMHHDYRNDNSQLDCGNWIGHLHDEWGDNFKWGWTANPIGLDSYGFTQEERDRAMLCGLNKLIGMQFDAVFICRSDQWTPPHIDEGFEELVNTVKGHFENVFLEKDIDKPRDISLYISELEKQTRKFVEEQGR